jgi:hypothetical protein
MLNTTNNNNHQQQPQQPQNPLPSTSCIPRRSRRDSFIPSTIQSPPSSPTSEQGTCIIDENVINKLNISVLRCNSLQEIVEKKEKELSSLREFSNLEHESLTHVLIEERKGIINLEDKKSLLESQIIELEEKANRNIKEKLINEYENSNSNKLNNLIIENQRLKLEVEQNKGGYDVLKNYCLNDFKCPTGNIKKLLANADRTIALIDI